VCIVSTVRTRKLKYEPGNNWVTLGYELGAVVGPTVLGVVVRTGCGVGLKRLETSILRTARGLTGAS
jgi:hypothetical protein